MLPLALCQRLKQALCVPAFVTAVAQQHSVTDSIQTATFLAASRQLTARLRESHSAIDNHALRLGGADHQTPPLASGIEMLHEESKPSRCAGHCYQVIPQQQQRQVEAGSNVWAGLVLMGWF